MVTLNKQMRFNLILSTRDTFKIKDINKLKVKLRNNFTIQIIMIKEL